VPPGRRWLDVGCGTGALAAAIYDGATPEHVACIEPSEGFLEAARARLPPHVWLRHGSAADLPLPAGSVDVTVSALVLNFVQHVDGALAEMTRVTRSGGLIAAYVWDYAGKMELMRRFWDAAIELNPRAHTLDERERFPLCAPDALTHAFTAAKLRDVEVTALEITTRFESFDDYWSPFLGGQGPAPTYVMSLDMAPRVHLRVRIRERMTIAGDGTIELTARAWAVKGTVA
jgi:SAM-dependent methyltransferase